QLAYNHMTAARRAAVYVKTAVLPLCDQIGKIDAARRETGQGQVDMPGCEEVRRDPANARLAYVEAMRDYWIARSQLEHAVGGRLDVPPPAGMP
ncbi:MAG: hypothetical protein IMZ65_04180, partial [Planctomycetes bacterium]|nr:hypothetical protein [Planctomycetota bacterium]